MTPDEIDKITYRLTAAWEKPKLSEKGEGAWRDHLQGMEFDRALVAMTSLERTKVTRPTIAEFHGAYEAHAPKPEDGRGVRPQCGICEDGWVDITPDAAFPHTWKRCPNGCLPLTTEERRARDYTYERNWDHEHRPDRQRLATVAAAHRDFTESSARHDPNEPF